MRRLNALAAPKSISPPAPVRSRRTRLLLVADVERGARVDASRLVQRIDGQRLAISVALRARPIGDGRDAELVEDVDVAPHAAGSRVRRGRRRTDNGKM